MQASPSTVTALSDEGAGSGTGSGTGSGAGSGTGSGTGTGPACGAAAPLAAQGFQLPSATLQLLLPAMSMHSETTSPR